MALLEDALLQLGMPTLAEFGKQPTIALLVIDQFEELFAPQTDPTERSAFYRWMSELPPFEQCHAHLIATIRSDYLNELYDIQSLYEVHKGQKIGDLRAMAIELSSAGSLPATLSGIGRAGRLDPWGRLYVYYPFPPRNGRAPPGGARKDRFLVPINSAYDLYSVGKDGGRGRSRQDCARSASHGAASDA